MSIGEDNKLLVGGAVNPEGDTFCLEGSFYLHGKFISQLCFLEIFSAFHHQGKLKPQEPALCQHSPMLLHVGFETVLQRLGGYNQSFPEEGTALGSADVEHIRKLGKILKSQVIIL